MDRRKFIGLMGSGLAASSVAPAFAIPPAQAPSGQPRPNILFIICDDLMFRTLHGLNNPEVHTPNLDRLMASGMAFTHCFHQGSWSGAVCLPSRTMLNSGLTAFHAQAGIDQVPTWGQTLGNAGYDTYICGKWHLDPTVLQRSFQQMGPIGPGMLESTLWAARLTTARTPATRGSPGMNPSRATGSIPVYGAMPNPTPFSTPRPCTRTTSLTIC